MGLLEVENYMVRLTAAILIRGGGGGWIRFA